MPPKKSGPRRPKLKDTGYTRSPMLGKFVKLDNGKERFFVKVVKKMDDDIYGRVDNKLISPSRYDVGDIIIFKKNNIVK